jgi:O-antigen ligase
MGGFTSTQTVLISRPSPTTKDALAGTFFWLTAFFVVYCARPEDWIPGLRYLPLAKITACCALIGFLASVNKTKRSLRDLPRESRYLLAIMGIMLLSGFLSPVWRGGAVLRTIEFCKVYIVWVLTILVINSFKKLRRIIYIQSASVAVICAVSIIKGGHRPRLEGVIGGIYSNANDLAFAIVLSLPFCLAFLVSSKGVFRKLFWFGGILIMLAALFLTASRAGFIDLVISGVVCLWHFGVKGRRFHLIIAAAFTVTVLMITLGGKLESRFEAMSGDAPNVMGAYGSYEVRKALIGKAFEAIGRYPILGIGAYNFMTYGGEWKEVHMTYLQIAAEGGIPVLILYLMFFARGFRNLRLLLRMRDLDPNMRLFVEAMHTSLVGFAVGALFAPEAYQFFPYFAVAYSATLLAIATNRENPVVPNTTSPLRSPRNLSLYGTHTRPNAVASK